MLKVILVDDEPYILQGLQVLIDWEGGGFETERFFLKLSTSLPFMAMYAVSNAVFLIILIFPFDKLFTRLKKKYGIGR